MCKGSYCALGPTRWPPSGGTAFATHTTLPIDTTGAMRSPMSEANVESTSLNSANGFLVESPPAGGWAVAANPLRTGSPRPLTNHAVLAAIPGSKLPNAQHWWQARRPNTGLLEEALWPMSPFSGA